MVCTERQAEQRVVCQRKAQFRQRFVRSQGGVALSLPTSNGRPAFRHLLLSQPLAKWHRNSLENSEQYLGAESL